MLGHTPVSWDDLSGEEQQPWTSIKSWAALTDNEKAAALSLGYTAVTWDNETGAEPQPGVIARYWIQLASCADGEISIPRPPPCRACGFFVSVSLLFVRWRCSC